MMWQYSPYFIPYIACGFILAMFGVTGWHHRAQVCARSFTILMAAASLWAFCTALELASADLPTQMLAIMIEYPAMVIIPVAWLLFAIEYTGRENWISKKTVLLLCIIPLVTVVMVVTNSFHYLFYSSIVEEAVGGLSYHIVTYGPAFWVHTIYSYSLIGLSILLILQRFLFSSNVYRAQVTIILIAVLLPVCINLILIFRLGSVALIDPTPFALMISGFAILYGMLRFQLLDITPVAHEQILANMRDGIIVSDLQERIVSLNHPAGIFLGISEEDAIGRLLTEVMPTSVSECIRTASLSEGMEQQHEIDREIGGQKRSFELRCILLRSRNTRVKGRMVLIRDITKQKQMETALFEARKKLSLLSSITRHDILNQVTSLLLHIDVAKESEPDPGVRDWLAKQEDAVVKIQHQVEFARDYEDLGVRPPQWMNVNAIFTRLKPAMDARGIAFDSTAGSVELFADPLLERVFYNLVDNSIRHGEHVTVIHLHYENIGDGLTLIYEDNGVGIPQLQKARIFERGVGRQTGLGLFLVVEILGITGITIRECGETGKGARFEVRVPPGQFRAGP
nr:histidine kinase N-terminal 7TM domain-containing protein [uncultured Methanoregula sp.]